jgi:anti-sigma regulatory factor (Ser/Thr protein kinase)
MSDTMTLEIPADPAYAVTARLFVGTAAHDLGLSDETVEDLRLAASELVANAVDAHEPGPIRLTLQIDDVGIRMSATGVGQLSQGPPIGRRSLLEALFADRAFFEDGTIQLRVPIDG